MIRTIGIVSLSRGILGEGFMHHELDIGVKRLQDYGVRVKFLPHALDGLESLAAHPEHRAQDLLDAFRDPEIDAILCAIGGDDTGSRHTCFPIMNFNAPCQRSPSSAFPTRRSTTSCSIRSDFRPSTGRHFCPTCASLRRKCFPTRGGIGRNS